MKDIIKIDRNLSVPLYVQVREGMKAAIADGRLKSGDRLPCERNLSKELGVSVNIIRQALSAIADEGLISRRPHRGTVVTDLAGGKICRPQTFAVGVIFPDLSPTFTEKVIQGIHDELRSSDYQMFLCCSDNDQKQEVSVVNTLVDRGVDGLIVFPVALRRGARGIYSHFRRLQQGNIPFVLLDRYIKSISSDYVSFDNFGGAREAVEHLISLGHRKIAHITVDQMATSVEERLRGYREALEGAGIRFDPSMVKEYSPEDGDMEKAAMDFVASGVTAIFCLKEIYALDLYRVFAKNNMRIPEDVSVVGFSEPRGLDRLGPGLTTIVPPACEMGMEAVRVLLDKVLGRESLRHVILPTRLVIGESTSSPGGCHV
ncbi:MAG: GntR family transcriptional regulator [Armatimonadota bacterium]